MALSPIKKDKEVIIEIAKEDYLVEDAKASEPKKRTRKKTNEDKNLDQ